MSTCPYCQKDFTRCMSKEGQKLCPLCHEPIFVVMRRKQKLILSAADYQIYKQASETAAKLVAMLREHISRRDKCEFTFNNSEYTAELVHAHALVERSVNYLAAQKDNLGLSPYDFIQEVAQEMLKDNYWQSITSWLMVRNAVGIFAQRLFRQKKQVTDKARLELSRLDYVSVGKEYMSVDYGLL